jgi:peptidoglycan glycosyltransferase
LSPRIGWKSFQKQKLSRGLPRRNGRSSFPRLTFKIILVIALCSFIYLAALYASRFVKKSPPRRDVEEIFRSAQESLKPSDINSAGVFREFSSPIDNKTYYVKLSLDQKLQERLETLLKRYKPPYAGVVAMDPETGKVLAMAGYSREDDSDTNWCLKSSFQAASIFKLVTSAAAIEKLNMQENSVIPFNGSLYRLRERNVFDKKQRFANRMTLGEAFAKSVNIVFAKLTQKGVETEDLKTYSGQLLFNKDIPFDFNVEESLANIPDDRLELAKTAAGFGDVTLSPLHGAVIASAILNDGVMVSPYVIDKLYNEERTLIHQRLPYYPKVLLATDTSKRIKNMMELTLTKGTIRKGFRGWSRDRILSGLNIGGKTGSLRGRYLLGENDWFVGFAENDEKSIVISAVIVNRALWHIKPTYLAKEAFLTFFGNSRYKKVTGSR